ncbi:MAG: TatD family hydrolase [Spirochaetota bacterium]|nr:TatD family hydrolase [Spirochaetota bacterium]
MDAYLHDVHFHLDLYKDQENIFHEIIKNKISTIAVTNLPQLYREIKKKINNPFIKVALGFHPELIYEYKKYIPIMWEELPTAQYIGEVGLDFKNGKHNINFQLQFFEQLVEKCHHLPNKTISIHSRRGEKEIINIIGNNFPGKIILHWYSGSIELLKEALHKGFYFSVNTAMISNEKGQNIIKNLPYDRILLESDAPFVKYRKQEYMPVMMKNVLQDLANLLGMESTILRQMLKNNFEKVI